MNKQKFYQTVWFMWVMLFLFAPIGIILLWSYKHHNKVARIVLTVFFSIVFITAITTEDEKKPDVEPAKEKVVEEKKKQFLKEKELRLKIQKQRKNRKNKNQLIH